MDGLGSDIKESLSIVGKMSSQNVSSLDSMIVLASILFTSDLIRRNIWATLCCAQSMNTQSIVFGPNFLLLVGGTTL